MKKLFKLLSENPHIFIDNNYISNGCFIIKKNSYMPLWLEKINNCKTELFAQINVPFEKGIKVKFTKNIILDSSGIYKMEITDRINIFYYNKKYLDIILESNNISISECDLYFCGDLQGTPFLKIFSRGNFLGLIVAIV